MCTDAKVSLRVHQIINSYVFSSTIIVGAARRSHMKHSLAPIMSFRSTPFGHAGHGLRSREAHAWQRGMVVGRKGKPSAWQCRSEVKAAGVTNWQSARAVPERQNEETKNEHNASKAITIMYYDKLCVQEIARTPILIENQSCPDHLIY
jgi:hypothetical protein